MNSWSRLILGLACFALLALPQQARAESCAIDCDASGSVTVDELLLALTSALSGGLEGCVARADLDGDQQITVPEIIVLVNQALIGCYEVGSCDDPAVIESEPLCALDSASVRCEFLDESHCLLPYPSSYFLADDPTTVTGKRVAFPRDAMPTNRVGVHIDPKEHNTFDGFSPGPILLAAFPQGVDLIASDVPTIENMPRGAEEDSPTVLIDAESGVRIPHFAELDLQAASPSRQAFMIRPGYRLEEGHRYLVAIRGLVAPDGAPIEPSRAFRILRDGDETPVRAIEDRRPAMEDIFTRLAAAGVERAGLQLAWDFTVASSESLTGRLVSARDQAIAANGPGAPPFVVTSVEENPDEHIFRRVRGTYTVPLFMDKATPPARYNLGPDGMPVQNGTTTAPFVVNIPRSAVADGVAHPSRPCVYGHGLFGTGEETNAGHLRAFSNSANIMFGGTAWIGMADEDVRWVTRMVSDLSGFAIIPDRLQQAMLNFMFLGRLFKFENGFVSHPAFQLDGEPLIDRSELYYYGISQGGIQGGTFLAISPDVARGVLGVGAINYSFLLQRSIDFTPFQIVLNVNYFDDVERALLYPILQQLWDRAEPNGYATRIIDNPLPGTPAKKVLMQIGVNDSQVSYQAAEIQARSMGLPTTAPSSTPAFGIPELEAPFDGSAYIPYDVNGMDNPLTNHAPVIENGVHEAVRRLPAAQQQIDAFLRPDGRIENFCPGACAFENVPNVTTN